MNNSNRSNIVSKIFRLTVKLIDNAITQGVAYAMGFIAIYIQFLSPRIPDVLTENDLLNISNFIEWFGVPYGLLIALVLVNVWSQFDNTDRSFDREADVITALYHTYQNIKNARVKQYVITALYRYATHVKGNYSKEFKHRDLRAKGNKFINGIRRVTGRLILRNKENDSFTAELLHLTNKLVDYRGDRIAYSKQRMPTAVIVLSYISSILWLIPFFALSFSAASIRIGYLFGVTFIVISLLLVIRDLDNPFSGTWSVNLESWDDLLNTLK